MVILINFSIYSKFIPYHQITIPFLILIVLGTFFYILLGFIYKNFHFAAVIYSPFGLMFLFGGKIYEFIGGLFANIKWRYIILILAATLISIIFLKYYIFLYKRIDHKFVNLNKIYFIIAISLIILNLLFVIFNGVRSKLTNLNSSINISYQTSPQIPKPDIYYIILDEYASLDQIKEDYGYDNKEFISFLNSLGFVVPDNCTSKYDFTNASLSDLLNLGVEIDNETTPYKDIGNRRFYLLKSADFMVRIRNNIVATIIKSLGYKYIHVGSWWRETSYNWKADININYSGFRLNNELIDLLTKSSLLRLILTNKKIYRDGIIYAFNELEKIPFYESPKFVLVHMLIPHAPFVFKENGEPVSWKDQLAGNHRSLYLGQYIFTTKMIKKLVATILSNSKESPIIVIHSDHG
ncbi:MAG: hypothetical protein QW134_07905, partial [Nitrososphaeria archaeon]